MSLLDIFRRKKTYSLSDFSVKMAEADVFALLPGFSDHIMDVVQRASIQFYRDIHSHEAGPFQEVRDEFFYLVFFVSQERIRSLFLAEPGEKITKALRHAISRRMSEIDPSHKIDNFWETYRSRETSYSALYTHYLDRKPLAVPENLPYIFSSYLKGHLNCPETLVRHHGIQMASTAIYLLEGRH